MIGAEFPRPTMHGEDTSRPDVEVFSRPRTGRDWREDPFSIRYLPCGGIRIIIEQTPDVSGKDRRIVVDLTFAAMLRFIAEGFRRMRLGLITPEIVNIKTGLVDEGTYAFADESR